MLLLQCTQEDLRERWFIMSSREVIIKIEKMNGEVIFGGFFIPLLLSFFIHVFLNDMLVFLFYDSKLGEFFQYFFSGVVNPIYRFSGCSRLLINILGVSVFGFPLWCLYWFFLGPKKILHGEVTAMLLIKFLFCFIGLVLVYLGFCHFDNDGALSYRAIQREKMIVNPIFFYAFVLSPIYFFSLCVSVFFRFFYMYLRR